MRPGSPKPLSKSLISLQGGASLGSADGSRRIFSARAGRRSRRIFSARPDQHFGRDAEAFMRTPDYADRQSSFSVQNLGDARARASDSFRSFRVSPCRSMRNLIASIGSGGSFTSV